MPTTRARLTHRSVLPKVWGINFNILYVKIHGHDTRGTIQDLHVGQLLQRRQEISGDVTPHVIRFWTIIRDLGLLEEHYSRGYGILPKDSNRRPWIFLVTKIRCRNAKHVHPPMQLHPYIVTMQKEEIQYQERMKYHYHMSCATFARKWYHMQ